MKSLVIRPLATSITLMAFFHGAAMLAASPETAVVPYKIHVDDATLADLKARLAKTRFPDEIPGAAWDYGTNLDYMKELITYWRSKYDWRAQEQRLNKYDQFTTNIDGVKIHFIHQRSKVPGARALLLLNGWPSSIEEFSQVIGPLTDPVAHGGRAEDAMNVVVPDMPGYGFSDKPKERGYSPDRMANTWIQLMARLGYAQYVAYGTDWGGSVATMLALKDSAHMTGLYLNSCLGGGAPPPPQAASANPRPSGGNDLTGYIELQSTKPQTLAFSLSDSPSGLAAWIIEKYQGWSDDGGNIESVFTKDQLLTTVMIYWVNNTGGSSARLYYETRHRNGRLIPFIEGFVPTGDWKVTVPTGCGNFTGRIVQPAPPRAGAEARYNVVYWKQIDHGGHFPAMEQPKLWLEDFRSFLETRH